MKNTMYWEVSYRGETGWKIKYYFGTEEGIINYTNKRLKFDKINYKNLTLEEVKILETMQKNFKFQVVKDT